MNFGFTEEQELLRDQVRRFMREACTMQKVRVLAKEQHGFDAELWKQVADLGWLGLITPEQYGGSGLKWIDLTVVLEETGRGLSPLPIASQILSTAAILKTGSASHKSDWLPAMADGSAICSLALYDDPNWIHPDAIQLEGIEADGQVVLNGAKPFVADAMCADYFLLACKVGDATHLAALHKDQVKITPQVPMDLTKPMGRVVLDNVTVDAEFVLPLARADLAFLTDCGAVAVTAEMVGAAEQTLAITSDYAKERRQFGKPIGQYQGVKHRLADIYVDVESFKSLLYYAAWTVDDAPDELPRAVSLAKGYASDAFARIGIDGVGLHGAIGFTAEYDIQLYLKRSKWARPMFGDSDYHLDRVATLGGL
ncbi:MAG: acyl-CoA/acyl-ACP dehydrogenase [Gammaproteobacteria bacterium]|nr:acyl-CoA/acyl-ACP dehydrogenase [Gammaproteobacteria bacterium]